MVLRVGVWRVAIALTLAYSTRAVMLAMHRQHEHETTLCELITCVFVYSERIPAAVPVHLRSTFINRQLTQLSHRHAISHYAVRSVAVRNLPLGGVPTSTHLTLLRFPRAISSHAGPSRRTQTVLLTINKRTKTRLIRNKRCFAPGPEPRWSRCFSALLLPTYLEELCWLDQCITGFGVLDIQVLVFSAGLSPC